MCSLSSKRDPVSLGVPLMTSKIESFVRKCTVKIEVPGVGIGTGFFIAKGIAVTCAHTLENNSRFESKPKLYWQNIEYQTIRAVKPEEPYDIAVIEIEIGDHP